MLRIGIDTGGTFTDLSVFDEDDGRVCLTHKVPSQPRNPTEAIAAGIGEITARLPEKARYVLHGTTIGLNTLLEGREPAPGLLVTEGFRDILELDRQWRGDQVYNLFFDRPRQLVPRHLIRPVRGRVDSRGREALPLDAEQARAGVRELLDAGVRSVAVSLLFSFANPDHERQLRAILEELAPDVYVTLSSEVDPQFREFERTSTAVVNAFIGPRVSSYVGTIENAINALLDGARVLIMQSNGGVATPGMIARAPVQTLMSGPVAGVVGTQGLCREIGHENAISLDIGGTSCDMSVIPGELLTAPQSKVAGYTVRAATVDIETIGSGGGSIARVESGRILKVGPQSAGAVPGPACYGSGDQPTLTDALVVLGHLNREALLDGAMPIDDDAARRAVGETIARPLEMTPERAAAGIVEVLAAQVAMSMRSVTIEKGYDPRDFILVAYGGAGPTVACPIARELEIPEICIPQDPGNFCAAGMLLTDLIRSHSLTRISPLGETPAAAIEEAFRELRDKGVRELQDQGVPPDSIDTEDFLDMRYPGQSYEVTVPAGDVGKEAISRLFHDTHGRLYGHTAEEEAMEIVNYRVRCIGRLPKMTFAAAPATGGPARAGSERPVLFPESPTPVSTPVYRRTGLTPGFRTAGPAIIDEYSSTTVVYPSFDLSVDAHGNLRLRNTA